MTTTPIKPASPLPLPLTLHEGALQANDAGGLPAFHCGLGIRGPRETHIMVAMAKYLTHAANSHEELVRQNGELREALRELLKEAQANFEVANKYLEDLQPSKAFVAAQALLSSLKAQGSPEDVLGHAATETAPLS